VKLAKGILVLTLSIGVLTGCGISEEDQAKIDKYDELSIKYDGLSIDYEELKGKYEDATGETLEETEESTEETGESTEVNEELEPKIGEYFEVEYTNEYEEIEGILGIKVVSVTETDKRSSKDEDVEHVAVIEFEFTNKTGAALTLRDNDFNVIDTEGFQGKTLSYGTDTTDFRVEIPKDAKAKANFRYEVGTPGPYAVQVGDMVIK